jgi:hypothetical protein
MDEMRRYGRRPKEGELINQKLQVWLTRSLRDQLERERQEAGVQSLGAFIRRKLGATAENGPALPQRGRGRRE